MRKSHVPKKTEQNKITMDIWTPEEFAALQAKAHLRGMTYDQYIKWCIVNWEDYLASQAQADERARLGL
jgi:hypothetical protein